MASSNKRLSPPDVLVDAVPRLQVAGSVRPQGGNESRVC